MLGRMTMRKILFSFFALMLLLPPLGMGLPKVIQAASVGFQTDFEDNTTQGWFGRGSSKVTAVADTGHKGSHSLKSSGRTQGWEGPGFDATALTAHAGTYDFHAWVRLESGHSDTVINVTVESNTIGNSQHNYNALVSGTKAKADEWTEISGSYTMPSNLDYLQIYLESPDVNLTFYMDDVSFLPQTSPPVSELVLNSDFEDGTTQNWYGRWGPTAVNTVTSATYAVHGGNHSLLATGRDATWKGPAINIGGLLEKDAEYEIEGWVRTFAGDDKKVSLSIVRGFEDSTENYPSIAYEKSVNSQSWTKLDGTFKNDKDYKTLDLYFQSSDLNFDFLIDDIRVVKIGGPSTEVPTNFTDDFEDGTTQGWVPRLGSETVTATTDGGHGGTQSLKVADRKSPYAGASKDVTDSLKVGSIYHFSAWAKLVSGTSGETIKMTMQTDKGTTANYSSISFESIDANRWTKIEGDYQYTSQVDQLRLYFESEHAGVDFYIDDVNMTKTEDQGELEIQKDIPSLKDVYKDDFLIGTAFTNDEITGANAELMVKHFNTVTPGNILKWDSTEPTEGNFRLDGADEAVQFALNNNIGVRGHTLVWHSQTPDWVFYDDNNQLVSKEVLYQRMENHIKTLVEHYQGEMYAWDVVNEVIDTSQPDGLRHSLWYQIAGEEYIEKAFEFAHAADPNAKLYINDYDTESPAKAQQLYNLVKRLKDKGVPVDGVGHQFHIDVEYPTIHNLEQAILKFADLGVEQQVTELDMSVYTSTSQKYTTLTDELSLQQAYRYKELFNVLLKHKDLVNGVTFWGKDDGHTWLSTFPVVRNNWPLLFDKKLQAKYAYWAIVDPSVLPALTKKSNAYKGIPTIDGDQDLPWQGVNATSIGSDGTLEGKFKTLWNDQKLYVWVDVKDATLDPDEAVQIYVNQSSDVNYILSRDGESTNGVVYTVKEVSGGYQLEAAISLTEPVSVGTQIGFDIRVKDGSGSVLSWNDKTNNDPSDPDHWGVILFKGPAQIADAVKGTPVIGTFDDVAWSKASIITTETYVEGTEGATAQARVLWDDGKLYVRAKVKDPILSDASPNAWEQDSFEIFVDFNNHKSATYESDDGQYRINFNNVVSYGDSTNKQGFMSQTRVLTDGYEVEVAIPVADISLAKDSIIGFDIQVNDDGAGNGSRSSVISWSDATGKGYVDTSNFGVLRLTEASEPGTKPDPNPGTKPDSGQISGFTPMSSVTQPSVKIDNNTITASPITDEKGIAKVNLQGIDLLSASKNAKNKQINIVVKQQTGTKTVLVQIPIESWMNNSQGINLIAVNTGFANVSIPMTLLNGQKVDASSTFLLSVSKVDNTNLPMNIQNMLCSNTVLDFSLTLNGKKLTGFKESGLQVAIPYTLQPGENPNQVVIYYIGDDGKLEVVSNGRFNPSTGTVEFKPKHFSKYSAKVVKVSFNDTEKFVWAKEGIEALVARGAIQGTGEETFAPNRKITRSEFVSAVIKLFDLSDSKVTSTFLDVKSSEPYYEDIATAQQLGIVNGKADRSFGVHDSITREEMAVIVYRAAQAMNADLVVTNETTKLIDSNQISSYATEAVETLVSGGIIKGTLNGKFNPQGSTTRAEATTILFRFYQFIN